jgi:nucleotide-binding universal stress UspA family protein
MKKTYNHIVVGIDSSNASRCAAGTAGRIAPRGVPIDIVHVVDPTCISFVKRSSELTENEFLNSVSQHVLNFVEQAGVTAPGMTVNVKVGDPVRHLTAACRDHEHSLLVLGTRGTKHGPNDIGTVASKCVRTAPADILLVREGAEKPFRRILACVDFSENSANVVRSAINIAEIDHSELECVYVVRGALGRPVNYGGILQVVTEATAATSKWLKEDLRQFLKPLFADSRLTPTGHVLGGGNVRDRIFEHARESKADLVVLGTHGETGFHTLLMGTTVENIVTHAPCSVLAVRPVEVTAHGRPVALEQS